MTTVPNVADGQLIATSWGNTVATVANNELVRRAGSTMTGRLILPDLSPQSDNEAARKLYVDNQVQNAEDAANAGLADRLAKAGGQMVAPANGGTGINMNNAPIFGLPAPQDSGHAARMAYVDAQVATALPKSGGTMSGDLNLGGHLAFNSKAITASDGGATLVTKQWVADNFQAKASAMMAASAEEDPIAELRARIDDLEARVAALEA